VQRQQPLSDIESSELSTADRSDDLKASRIDAPRPSQHSVKDAAQSRPSETATPATTTPKPATSSHAPAAPKVQATALPAHLKSRLNLPPSEQAGKAPATQDMELRHGKCLSTIIEEDSLID
jgi:hypothetical protein